MRNVLQIVTDALDELGFPTPTAVVGIDGPTQRQILAVLCASARALRSQRIWPQQKKRATITTVAGTSFYPFATDYYSALLQTQWDETRKLKLIGPLSDSDMAARRILGMAGYTGYRIFGPDINPASTAGQIEISPTPDSVRTLSYEYVTRNMFCDSTYTTYTELPAADTNYCLFDDDLMIADFKWRYLRAKKKDYAQEQTDAVKAIEGALGRWTGTTIGSFNSPTYAPNYTRLPGSWPI